MVVSINDHNKIFEYFLTFVSMQTENKLQLSRYVNKQEIKFGHISRKGQYSSEQYHGLHLCLQ